LQRAQDILHSEPKKLFDEFVGLRRLISCELGDRTCTEYIHELKSIAQEFLDAQRPVYNEFLIAILATGLPTKSEAFVAGVINHLPLKTVEDDSSEDLKKTID